jgi:hypothetical protein
MPGDQLAFLHRKELVMPRRRKFRKVVTTVNAQISAHRVWMRLVARQVAVQIRCARSRDRQLAAPA